MKSQKGAYLVLMSVLLTVLIGFGALSIDLGRIFVLQAEMQNAADAAALAAAMELKGTPGSRARAETAARYRLQHGSRFAEEDDLLGASITLEFFCAIGSKYDPTATNIQKFCSNPYVGGRSVAVSDAEARYVRVTMSPDDASQAYTLRLFFLPVLNAGTEDANSLVRLGASALAGRHFYICNIPQMMICNPFENTSSNFATEVEPGQQFFLGQQSVSWGPGNFAFLDPDAKRGGGARDISEYLADEGITGCISAIFMTSTGSMTMTTASALNTRFDIYAAPAPFNGPDAARRWPPAPNVISYPRDQTWRAVDSRYGYGDWDRNSYFETYHDWRHTRPPGWEEMTRWETYNWEISEGKLPSKFPLRTTTDTTYDGIPDPNNLYTGTYPPAISVAERRLLHVAVINCAAHDLSGGTTFPMVPPEGFAKLFLTERVVSPPNGATLAEYVGWLDAGDGNFHIDVQLYE
jgi:hypothetical protein